MNKKNSEKEVIEFIRFSEQYLMPGKKSDTIIGFAEPGGINWANVILALGPDWQKTQCMTKKIVVITNIINGQITGISEFGKFYFINISRPSGSVARSLIVCFIHLDSPFGKWQKESNAQSEAREARDRIVEMESKWSVPDSIVLGDLNMDPYEPAMTNGRGMNAAMCKHVAQQNTRKFGPKHSKEVVRLFYNPMWRILGDRTAGNQPGSYRNSGDKTDAVVWHCIDQVLLRPSLIEKISPGTPFIVTSFGSVNLLSQEGVLNNKISDHLPILVSLDL